MKRITITGACLIAVLALSAVASSIAAAGPVFYTKAAIGEVGKAVPVTGTFLEAELETKSGTKIKCTSGTASGEVVSATKAVKNVTTFKGCETGGFKCESGAVEGEIETFSLEGELGAISPTLPGLRLFREGDKGGEVAAFSCQSGTDKVKVMGSLIGSISGAAGTEPANGKFGASDKLAFAQAGGVQKYTKFEGEAEGKQLEASLEGKPFELSGQKVSVTLKSVPASNLNVTK